MSRQSLLADRRIVLPSLQRSADKHFLATNGRFEAVIPEPPVADTGRELSYPRYALKCRWMTIREYIARRRRIGQGAASIRQTLTAWFRFLWLGLLMIGVFASSWRDNGYNHSLRIGVLTFLIVTVFGLFAFGFRCPRCRISLVPKASDILRTRPYACPRCGVSIDEKREP
jgi:hypothetical protein